MGRGGGGGRQEERMGGEGRGGGPSGGGGGEGGKERGRREFSCPLSTRSPNSSPVPSAPIPACCWGLMSSTCLPSSLSLSLSLPLLVSLLALPPSPSSPFGSVVFAMTISILPISVWMWPVPRSKWLLFERMVAPTPTITPVSASLERLT